MLYFAYGTDMCHEIMNRRYPGSVFCRRAYLNGFSFCYDNHSPEKRTAATLILAARGFVFGGLFDISNKYKAILRDTFPSSEGYKQIAVTLRDDQAKPYNAVTYYRSAYRSDQLPNKYRIYIIKGAMDCALPHDYIERVLDR